MALYDALLLSLVAKYTVHCAKTMRASEDIGNANPTALVLANNTFQAVERIGWPEARIVRDHALPCFVRLQTIDDQLQRVQQTTRIASTRPQKRVLLRDSDFQSRHPFVVFERPVHKPHQ